MRHFKFVAGVVIVLLALCLASPGIRAGKGSSDKGKGATVSIPVQSGVKMHSAKPAAAEMEVVAAGISSGVAENYEPGRVEKGPEAATLLGLGAVLLGLAALARRRFRRT